jgi:hypothetical protein
LLKRAGRYIDMAYPFSHERHEPLHTNPIQSLSNLATLFSYRIVSFIGRDCGISFDGIYFRSEVPVNHTWWYQRLQHIEAVFMPVR